MKQIQVRQIDNDVSASIAQRLGCHPITAGVLASRGLADEQALQSFLKPALGSLTHPGKLKDMDKAVSRLTEAMMNGERIVIFSDYDVDGVCSAALLYTLFHTVGLDVSYYVPDRFKEGYGLQPEFIKRWAAPNQVDLIITVDNGIGSAEAVREASRHGIDVIVTDHHEICGPIPRAVAVIDPKQPDCESGLDYLCGCGVAFYLLMALRANWRDLGVWEEIPEPNLRALCDLVAIATVADVVPLVGDNRVLTRTGLDMIRAGCVRPGLQALFDVSKVSTDNVVASDFGFRLGPRINAAGRMKHARLAVDLLVSQDPSEAQELALTLDGLNNERKETEKAAFDQIRTLLESDQKRAQGPVIVLAEEGWHCGVMGIVASRVVEAYRRPTILIAIDNSGVGKGSARSIPGFDMHAALSRCSDHLIRFGGHELAAGVTVERDRIEPFRSCLNAVASKMMDGVDVDPALMVDAVLPLDQISEKLLDELAGLEPYGAGNPEPVFVAEDVVVEESRILCAAHRKMVLRPSASRTGQNRVSAIQFNIDVDPPLAQQFSKIAFKAGWNYWNGNRQPQLTIIQGQGSQMAINDLDKLFGLGRFSP